MSKLFKLRPYQKAAVAAVVSRYQNQNQRRMLLYLPTGAGKTVIAAFIIKALRRMPGFGKALFIAHRREILDQTARTIKQHLPKLKVQIEQGERTSHGASAVTLASVQSMVRRKERYDPKEYALVICDECHRALAPTWEEVIEYFHARAGEGTLLLGMTATPQRTDGRSALDVFGRTAFEISRTDLEDLGYLVPMKYFTVRSNLNLNRVKMSGGDFQVGALSKVMDAPTTRALTVKAWLEQGKEKKTLVFCAGVEHARHLSDDFNALGIRAEKIDGKTKNRGELLRLFMQGDIQVLTNYGVLTEGFDDPSVECILMVRPTTSPLVYTQCVGRGLRTAPEKATCTVIDIVDRSTHQLQYGATQMAGLSRKWRCSGGDPFRQARSMAGIKITSPEAFLRVRDATSMEEVQSVLMSLPPEVVVAGLDGEPVLRYTSPAEEISEEQAKKEALAILKQARVRGAKLVLEDNILQVAFRSPETDNERYAYLKWHLSRVTGRIIVYKTPTRKNRRSSPRALLRSMLPDGCHIADFTMSSPQNTITAIITGLTSHEGEEISDDFQSEYGMKLDLKGQMTLF
ncbi:MAG: DEAD/DEAH box helicase [Deltaproteobacteria bacterium]|nr:DEAD/DEAH box helicase [Deltaproteobacteria bacterium]